MSPIENENEENFAELFEQSLKKKRRFIQPGERVSGTVMQVGEKRLLVDLGDGIDAMMEVSELGEPGSRPEVKVGDTVEGYVLHADDRLVELGRSVGKGVGGKRALEDAARSHAPIEGVVTEVNKGGYVVEIHSVRCFCPLGQMDVRRIDDPNTMIGQKLLFKVTEMRGGRDAVLSRRVLLEAEAADFAAKTRESLQQGAHFRGKVTNVRDFGAFVDIGGIEGLVPASELGYGRLRPQDVVRPGMEVDVEVLRMEVKDGKERITLSMRALAEDPFDAAMDLLQPGNVLLGRVTRAQPFGAFVELAPGVEGLIHVSAFGRRIGQPSEVVATGQAVAVRVEKVDFDQRRIGLSYVTSEELNAHNIEVPAELKAAEEAAAPKDAKAGGKTVMRRAEKAPEPAVGEVPAAEGGELRILGTLERMAAAPVEEPEMPGEKKAARPRLGPPPRPKEGDVFDVTVDKVEPFGVFVKWDTGRGLVPGVELGVPRNTDLRKNFPVGTNFRATVLEVRPDGKVRLSKTAVERADERAETEAYMRDSSKPAGKGFGTFGDLFKGKLGK